MACSRVNFIRLMGNTAVESSETTDPERHSCDVYLCIYVDWSDDEGVNDVGGCSCAATAELNIVTVTKMNSAQWLVA
jgi:hypothetical protein